MFSNVNDASCPPWFGSHPFSSFCLLVIRQVIYFWASSLPSLSHSVSLSLKEALTGILRKWTSGSGYQSYQPLSQGLCGPPPPTIPSCLWMRLNCRLCLISFVSLEVEHSVLIGKLGRSLTHIGFIQLKFFVFVFHLYVYNLPLSTKAWM